MKQIVKIYEYQKQTKNYVVYTSPNGLYDVIGAVYVQKDAIIKDGVIPNKVQVMVEPIASH